MTVEETTREEEGSARRFFGLKSWHWLVILILLVNGIWSMGPAGAGVLLFRIVVGLAFLYLIARLITG